MAIYFFNKIDSNKIDSNKIDTHGKFIIKYRIFKKFNKYDFFDINKTKINEHLICAHASQILKININTKNSEKKIEETKDSFEHLTKI